MPTIFDAVKSGLKGSRYARTLLKPLLPYVRSLSALIQGEQSAGSASSNSSGRSPLHQPFIYNIDVPATGEVKFPFLILSGWIVYSRDSRIENLAFCTQSGLEHALTTGDRSDVEATFPDQSAIGFLGCIPIEALKGTESYSVQFAIDGNPHSFPVELSISAAKVESFISRKHKKLQKLQAILQCPSCGHEPLAMADATVRCNHCGATFEHTTQRYNFLSQELANYGNIKSTHSVSCNPYDETTMTLISEFSDGLILDNGCGMRDDYFDNVINFEIVDYPTTDVLGIGEKLPFKSNSFDAVLSFTVLEHVKNPFECATEIIRVLKPGGKLYAVVPFLQPFHGYPDHYYNMTSSGLKNLFGAQMEILEVGIAPWGKPIMTLNWFLKSYLRGLPTPVAEKFKQMRIADLLDSPFTYLEKDFVAQVAPEVNEELACSNFLIAQKK